MTAHQPFISKIYKKFIPVLLLLFVVYAGHTQDVQLTVIANPKGAPSEMKSSELKSVLKGEKQRWSDGTKVSIYIMKTNTPVGQSTCQKVYNMSGDRVKRYWLELTFSGKADAPTFCNSIEELESNVSQTPGAIGILDKVSNSSGVKKVLIDGKSPF